MNNKNFCHLHLHSEYSQLDGFGSAKNYVKRAKELGFEYLTITDHGNIDGTIQFQKECKKENIKPIIGCEAYIVPNAKKKEKSEKRYHCTLLVKNQQGWNNLLKMLTYANVEGFYHKPRIDYDFLIDNVDGLVVLTGCSNTFLLHDDGIDFLKDLLEYTECFLEVMPFNFEDQKRVNKAILDLHSGLKLDLVGTNDCHYIIKSDVVAHEVLLALQRQAKWNDKDRWTFGDGELYLRSADEMFESFKNQGVLDDKQIRQCLENTIKIAELCKEFEIKKQDIYLPTVYSGDENKILEDLCIQGFGNKLPDVDFLGTKHEYVERFEEEFKLIKKKGFAKYFLVVYELVNWCHQNNIMIGPGRGSVGGSLIAYLLGITSVDPIKFKLLFFRFISVERIDYPDIDIDFEDSKRHLIREHLEELYGKDNISGISTFLKMKAKAAIRDVSRVFDVPYSEVDKFTKAVVDDDNNPDADDLILRTIKETDEGKEFERKYPKVIRYASQLEGQIKASGQHAAAVVVSGESLLNGNKCNIVNRGDKRVCNWDMKDSEYVGLMKLDILGLNVLSIFNETKRLIFENHGKNYFYHEPSDTFIIDNIDNMKEDSSEALFLDDLGEFSFEKISLNDSKVLDMFSQGKTIGVFQFNSHGISDLCKKMGIESFNDLVAINALYRPGPLRSGMIEEYIERKKSGKWESYNDVVDDITKDTYGVIVYQEQVMRIANEVAKMSWKKADEIRKVIGKSKGSKELAKFKDEFVKGCIDNKTLSKIKAEKLWEEIVTFGGYGFNLSHSTEYSMIGYWCMWCKVYYPTEFICANLSYGANDKKEEIINEAYSLGLSVVTPKVGLSDPFIWRAKDNKLYAPFIEIKGLGEKTAVSASNFKQTKTSNRKGFFNTKANNDDKKSKIEKLLDQIHAFDDTIPDNVSDLFSFKISNEPEIIYPKLFELIGKNKLRPSDLERALIGQYLVPDLFKKKRFNINEVVECEKCELTDECKKPVVTSRGLYNIFFVGEAPGKTEDKEGKGFVGESGTDILWPEIVKYGLRREKFHVSNICRCYPSKTKTPGKKHIEKCLPWLIEELKKTECKLILAMGNTCIKAFTDKDGGITDLNGTTTWNEKHGIWISWCIHPASVIYNRKENLKKFEEGIKNFIDTIKSLSGLDEVMI